MEPSSILHGMDVFPCRFRQICIGDAFVSQNVGKSANKCRLISFSLVTGVGINRSPFDSTLTSLSVNL